jgi:hypothetical protein
LHWQMAPGPRRVEPNVPRACSTALDARLATRL